MHKEGPRAPCCCCPIVCKEFFNFFLSFTHTHTSLGVRFSHLRSLTHTGQVGKARNITPIASTHRDTLSFSQGLSYTHMRTHARAHTRIRTHPSTHKLSLSFQLARSLFPSVFFALSFSLTHCLSLLLSLLHERCLP